METIVEESMSKRDRFIALAKPLIKLLNDDYDPHTSIIIDCIHAELLSGEIAYSTDSEI